MFIIREARNQGGREREKERERERGREKCWGCGTREQMACPPVVVSAPVYRFGRVVLGTGSS